MKWGKIDVFYESLYDGVSHTRAIQNRILHMACSPCISEASSVPEVAASQKETEPPAVMKQKDAVTEVASTKTPPNSPESQASPVTVQSQENGSQEVEVVPASGQSEGGQEADAVGQQSESTCQSTNKESSHSEASETQSDKSIPERNQEVGETEGKAKENGTAIVGGVKSEESGNKTESVATESQVALPGEWNPAVSANKKSDRNPPEKETQ